MSWSRISAADVAARAWANGGGTTKELLAWPHSNDWALRVSVAEVGSNGPFSSFPGVRRWLGVLRGKGLRVFDWVQRPGDELLAFDGALAPDCEMVAGPCTVVNFMHRSARGVFSVEDAHHAFLPGVSESAWVGLFTAEGGLLEHGARAMPVAPRTLAWCEAPAAQSCLFTGEGAAWWLSWKPQ
jgi:hypothetical protein